MRWERSLARLLGSTRLALALIAALCVLAGLGSIQPAEQAAEGVRERFGERAVIVARAVGLVDTYRSPLFLALLSGLGVNVAVCTTTRFRAAALSSGRPLRLWSDAAMHASFVLLLVGGGLKGAVGVTGTKYLFAGRPIVGLDRWPDRAAVPLGFEVVWDGHRDIFFPLQVRMTCRSPAGEERQVEAREGRVASVASGALTLLPVDVSWGTKRFAMEASTGSERGRFDLDLAGGEAGRFALGGWACKLTAYAQIPKETHNRLTIREGGRTAGGGWLTPRSGVSHRGWVFYGIAEGSDEDGTSYIGLQATRDPAAPLFWAGALLLCLTTPMLLVVRHRGRRGREGGQSELPRR